MRSAERRGASKDYPVASRDSMLRRAEERSRLTGQSLNEAAEMVVEDLERATAALRARGRPHWCLPAACSWPPQGYC
jgi:hypothetical protein